MLEWNRAHTRTRARLSLTALVTLAAPLGAQTGGFVVTLGADTVQIERFARTGDRVTGTLVQRTPSLRIVRYTLDYADGKLRRYEIDTRTADGAPIPTAGFTGSLTFLRDSVIRDATQNGQAVTQRMPAPNGAFPSPGLPYLGVTLLAYEAGFAQARSAVGTNGEGTWSPITMVPAQLQPQRTRIWMFSGDSVEADYFGVARSGYRFNGAGELVRLDWTGTTYKYIGVRVAAPDVEAITSRWAADEKAGMRMGAVSPRDTLRASVGKSAITIEYSRPAKRGRRVWGELVPWDQVWRFGADVATHFSTTADITIGGSVIPAGRYTLWMVPSEKGSSTLVVNSRTNIFGTAYNAATDFVRIPLERSAKRDTTERFTLGISEGALWIRWDDATWGAPIGVAQPSRESLLATDRLNSDVVAQRGFRDGVNAMMTPDGALLYPGAPVVRGSGAITGLLAAQPLLDSLTVRWQPMSATMAKDGRFALTLGTIVTLPRNVANPAPRMGNYAHVWRWSDSTGWRVIAALHAGVVPPARTVLPPTIGPLELPPLSATGPAGPFIAADLAFTKLANTADPATAFRTYAAPDAMILSPTNELRRGPEEVSAPLKGGPPVDWNWHPVVAGASTDGGMGFTIGESTIRSKDGSRPPSLSKYLSVWMRQANGSVRYIYDGGNVRPAAR